MTVAQSFYVFQPTLTPVKAATTANQSGTYYNGELNNGIGATFTYGSTGVLTIDGQTIYLNDCVLFKDQSSSYQNGIYICTVEGNSTTAAVLTRRSDFQSPEQMKIGQYVSAGAGTTNGGNIYTVISPLPNNIGVDAITFSNAGNGVYLQKANNLSDVASASISRTNLGLGEAATKSVTNSGANTVASYVGTAPSASGNFSKLDAFGSVEDGGAIFKAAQLVWGGTTPVTVTCAGMTSSSLAFASLKTTGTPQAITNVTPGSGSCSVALAGATGDASSVMSIFYTSGTF